MRFDRRYKIYLDTTAQSSWVWNYEGSMANWVEVFPHIEPFKWELFEEELFHRYKWGIVTFRDEPYISSSIHNTIVNLDITQEIRIKVVINVNHVIRGYFGANDCDFNEDNQVLTVTPAILDQYTDVLENYETEVTIFGGDTNIYKTRWELTAKTPGITTNNNVPLSLVATNFQDAQSQTQEGIPNGTGAFISNTKSKYKLQIEGSLYIAINILSIQNIKFYIREYNNLNLQIQEIEIASFFNTSGTEKATIPIEELITVQKGSNVTLECDISDPGDFDFVSYLDADLTVVASEIKDDGNILDINLTSVEIQSVDAWTEVRHGRASPRERDWNGAQSLEDYFNDLDGSPDLDGHFTDSEFGPKPGAGATFKNGKDILSEPIGGVRLDQLVSLLDEYSYELSSVTIYEGTKYWAGFKKKRRVYATCSFSREEYLKDDNADAPPADLGWKPTDYKPEGKTMYVRKPFNGVITNWNLSTVDESRGQFEGTTWYKKITSTRVYPPMEDAKQTFSNAIGLKDIIKKIYNNTSDLLANNDIYSTFFWNDLEASFPTISTGQNYVTGNIPNELNNIDCVHVKDFDIADTDLLSEDRILRFSFKKMIEDLRVLFPIYWFVKENGDLYIEHVKYIDLINTTSTPNLITNNPLIDETLKFDYDKDKMFATITHELENSAYPDFTNNKREFDKIASNKRNQDFKLELKTQHLTTDVRYCIENASSLSFDSLCLIAYDENNAIINESAPVSNTKVANGLLALSNLLNKYWKYEGVWLVGKINGVDANFMKSSRTKIGKSLFLKGLYDRDSSGNEINFITTYLGVGFVKSMSIDLERAISTDIILLYRFDESTQGDNLKSGNISDKFVLIASEDVPFDFGNY